MYLIHINNCYKFNVFLDSCDAHKAEENQKSTIDPNLYLYDDDLESRPHISTFISSIANYENTIPAATDPDAKPPPPSARMGMYHLKIFNVFRKKLRTVLTKIG